MAKGKGKKLHSMRIEPASNGYTVHSHHEQEPSKDGSSSYQDDKPAVFGSKDDVLKHVASKLDEHESASGGGSSDDKSNHPLRKGLFGSKKKPSASVMDADCPSY